MGLPGYPTVKLLPLQEFRHDTDFEESVAKKAAHGENNVTTYGDR